MTATRSMADGSRAFEFRRRVGDDASELDEVASADGSAEAWRGGADVSRGDGGGSARLRRTPSQFMLDALRAGAPAGEVPWGGDETTRGAALDDDDEPAAAPPEPFSWGAARAPDAASNRVERGARDGRKMKASATRYRAMTNAGARRRAGEVRRHFGDARGVPEPTSTPSEDANEENERSVDPPSARDVLGEARAILAEKNAEDDDLLPPENAERIWVDEEEEAKRRNAAGEEDPSKLLGAWGIPPLRPSEADVAKQRMYERVHRMNFRRRNGAHAFGNPDEIDELVLDVDRAEIEEEKRRAAFETRRRASDTPEKNQRSADDDARGANDRGAAPVNDATTIHVADPRAPPLWRGETRRAGYLTPATGNLLDQVLGEDRVRAAMTAADKGQNDPEAIAMRTRFEKAPPHLRPYMRPQELDLPEGAQVVKISGGESHAIVLLKTSDNLERVLPRHQDNDGRVLVLGSSDDGQLGLGDNRPQTIPAALSTLTEASASGTGGGGAGFVRSGGDRLGGLGGGTRRAIDVAAGAAHSVVVTRECEAAAFGADTNGSTGQGDDGEGMTFRTPRWMYWVGVDDTTRVVACAAGRGHTVLLTATRRVLTLGDGALGQLGHGDARSRRKPARVEALVGIEIVAVSAGGDHTLCVTSAGLLYGWGANARGQLGLGDDATRKTPVRIAHETWAGGEPIGDGSDDPEPEKRVLDLQERILGPLPGTKGRFVSASEANRAFAQPTEQQLAAAVKAREEALGIRRPPDDDELRLRMGLRHSKARCEKVIQACGGLAHTVVLTDAGKVYTFGASDAGQLGHGDSESRSRPTMVSTMVNLSVVQVAAGDEHTAVLTSLGHAYACGQNELGQLGDGTLASSFDFKCLHPVVSETEMRRMTEHGRKTVINHPMYGVTCEQVYAAGASTFAVVVGGERVFACGAGAYGNPHERNPTGFSDLFRETLDERESKKAMVMESTVRMLRPDDQSFLDLTRQMVLYSLYNERVLSHVMKTMLEEVLRKPGFVVMYGKLLERLAALCLGCPIAHFRRVILLAIEDMGVRMLQAQDDALKRRVLQKMGWEKYQKQMSEGARGVGGAGGQMTYYGTITDKASYEDFKKFRDDCKSLQAFVREIFEVQKVLLDDDVRDLAAGFPGSQHSVGISDSEEAQKKMTFFRGLARWKSPGERAAEEAERAAGIKITSRAAAAAAARASDGDGADEGIVRQRGLVANKAVPSRGADEAAWEFSQDAGWEAYRVPEEDVRPNDEVGWAQYLERVRRDAKFRSPVVDIEDEDEAGTGSKKPKDSRRIGIGGKRIVESTLAASYHPDNTVMTASRAELEAMMARRRAAQSGKALETTSGEADRAGGDSLASRQRKLELKLASMAASGESVVRIEYFKYLAETKPAFGFCTQEEVDAVTPAQQLEWKQAAYRFQRAKADQEDDREQTIEL